MYIDNRPMATLRLEAEDQGIILPYGDGPDQCDINGSREAIIFEENGIYHLFYDGAGPNGWLACLATSKDLSQWTKRGPILDFGELGEMDSGAAISPWVFKENNEWHMFYIGTPNTSPPPDRLPDFPYLTMKAKSQSLAGPWIKQKDVIPFRTKPDTYYASTASAGHIIKYNGEYLQFFSSTVYNVVSVKRTIGIARTKNLNGSWIPNSEPIFPLDEQVENSSIYYEPANNTWFLFTNHIGVNGKSEEFTDAIWVYWSKDPLKWEMHNKAVVLDGTSCKWSKSCIGMPSVIKVGGRLAVFYDAPGQESISHMKRSLGLAWLDLPLFPPATMA